MRSSGILMPISSLPSPYGIGTLGQAAHDFVDFLVESGQKYWQILPVGPTGFGDSPYQSFSAFACNPYFIDLDMLAEQGLLTASDLKEQKCKNSDHVDYGRLFLKRFDALKIAASNLDENNEEYKSFVRENSFWLEDYALFMALKYANEMKSFSSWDEPLRRHEDWAVAQAREKHLDEIVFWRKIQYLFFDQWKQLKAYANEHDVYFIGDLPIYVAMDSADMWSDSRLFKVDGNLRPTAVAGCPPDGFCADGQLWGNPIYDWDYHLHTCFEWWVSRLRHAQSIYDIIRIDHFRAFAGYYSIPAGDKTAANGHWETGPAYPFIDTIKFAVPGLNIIAEDLGFLTEDVQKLLTHSGFPGMKVLQFAFDASAESSYLPHNYDKNCVVYTGTHDNTTTADWAKTAPEEDIEFTREYLNLSKDADLNTAMIKVAMSSVADISIIPIQDWLGLGAEARMNAPSTAMGNWTWRVKSTALTEKLAKNILRLTKIYGRSGE